ncbi:MAG: methyltransferase domain-containing protein [Candidatus Promineifilaceae bacterium]|nr:methyltransferase domain-containing protein [Candidatus Promineifilaceae bacterium]
MLRRLRFRFMYWLRRTPWDSGETPPEVLEALNEMAPGRMLDLGCGTGTNVIALARRGWQATGLDFVPAAIRQAKRKAAEAGVQQRTRFEVADVTRLGDLDLAPADFALDIGCFHGLDEEGQRRYVEGLAPLLPPGARYMLYVLPPRHALGATFGMQEAQVRAVFEPAFKITRVLPGGFQDGPGTWFWMERGALPDI